MSEFKYACPVCGQHIRCDSSQSGSVMECPTCFQKITVPQSPASDEQKFILAGSKVTEKKKFAPKDAGGTVAPKKKSPVAAIAIAIAFLAAGAGIFFFGGKSISVKPSRPASASAWEASDIGAVGAAGSFSQTDNGFTINGSGADTWNQADGFYYVFQPLNGDGSLTIQVLNIQNTDEWAKAGVMIRETTNASSVFALASIRADGQAQFIWRNLTGAAAAAWGLVGGPGYPKWVKVVRSGNSFSAYYKVNAGAIWEQLGTSQTINMSPNTQIGLIVCAHNAGTLCQAQFDNVTLQSDLKASPAVAPRAPKLIAPPANDTNWMLNLDAVTNFPDATAVGRVHGQGFICGHAILQGGMLTLRGAGNLSVAINFSGAKAEMCIRDRIKTGHAHASRTRN